MYHSAPGLPLAPPRRAAKEKRPILGRRQSFHLSQPLHWAPKRYACPHDHQCHAPLPPSLRTPSSYPSDRCPRQLGHVEKCPRERPPPSHTRRRECRSTRQAWQGGPRRTGGACSSRYLLDPAMFERLRRPGSLCRDRGALALEPRTRPNTPQHPPPSLTRPLHPRQ
eukprot:scaffold174224_cov29-Tisochrysis_lutea.AAC.3